MTTVQANPSGSGLRSAIVNGSYQSATNLYYLLVRSIYVVIFARIVGVEQYGYYAYSQSWYVMMLPIANWGMSELLLAEYARARSSDRAALAGAGLNLRLVLGTVSTVTVMLAASFFEPHASLRLLILIYAQGVLASGLTNWIHALFIAREKNKYVLYLTAPLLTLEVLLITVAAYQGASLVTIAILQCSMWWLGLGIAYLFYRSKFESVTLRIDSRYNRYFLFKGPVLASASFIFSFFGPGLLIAYRYIVDDVGRLGEAALVMQVFIILSQMIKVVSNSALPQLNRISPRSSERQKFFAMTVWKNALYIGGAFFLFLYCLLTPVVAGFVGPEFGAAATTFAHSSWIIIPLIIVQGLRLVLITGRRMHFFLLATLAGLVALALQLAALVYLDKLDTSMLFVSLGGAYFVVAGLMLSFVAVQLQIRPVMDLAVPIVFLAACLLLFFVLLPYSLVMALVIALTLLLTASIVDFRIMYHRMQNS